MRPLSAVFPLVVSAALGCQSPAPSAGTSSAVTTSHVDCDVIVAGGTTAALSTALAAAREGAVTCLLEPTDWPGGQLTAAGVPAIDYAWHKIGSYDIGAIAKDPANLPRDLVAWMSRVSAPGSCWVSKDCYEPKALLTSAILPAIAAEPNLKLFTNTVVKRVATTSIGGKTRIVSVTAVRRTPTAQVGWGGYDARRSDDLLDWYSTSDSARYTKTILTFANERSGTPIVVDATDFGDVLVLAGAPYLQGVETNEGDTVVGNDRCGQAFVDPFVMRWQPAPVADDLPPTAPDHPERYSLNGTTWTRVWTYRRVRGSGSTPAVGDLSNQNWNPGNDYPYAYLLAPVAAAASERNDWHGGVDLSALEAAERHAWGWFRWFRDAEPTGNGTHLAMARDVFGTGDGLSKMPYVRDTRRSVGVGGFLLTSSNFVGDATQLTGTRFADRVAIGVYAADIHSMVGCNYPAYVTRSLAPLPFYIPLRALTNRDVANLVVAGKTMAQSFLADAATRLHPIELSSGFGAGAAAAEMVARGAVDTESLLTEGAVAAVQARAARYTPVNWTIHGVAYPQPGDPLGSFDPHLFCPPATTPDLTLGYCVDADNAYGPFTHAMTSACLAGGGGSACAATLRFTIDGHAVDIPRWSRSFAAALRGGGACMKGAHRDGVHPEVCVEEAGDSASGVKEAYGPFDAPLVAACLHNGGGDACYGNRWSYAFYASLASL